MNVPRHVPNPSKIRAYYEKTRAGLHDVAKRPIFLDADTIVTAPEFFNIFEAITPGAVLACPSAQDRDFSLTYGACEEIIRSLSDIDGFTLDWQIADSGVWAAAGDTARTLAAEWAQMFLSVIEHEPLWRCISPGTSVGDQEFMLLSVTKSGLRWHKLHGSYNMHLDDKQMTWQENLGGHFSEAPEIIKAVHYGAEPMKRKDISDSMIADRDARAFLGDQYRVVKQYLFTKLSKDKGITV